MKIYISGKITGIEEEAKALFAQAQRTFEAAGFEVINPMALPHLHDQQWHSYMREDIKALCDCDAIYMLPNWLESKGAVLEELVARQIGLKVIYPEDYDTKKVDIKIETEINKGNAKTNHLYREVKPMLQKL